MRVLVTGATGNIGKGIVPKLLTLGYDLVLSDIAAPTGNPDFEDLPYFQCDVQSGFGLEKAAQGCDAILHLPAWHGIHHREKTEIDFWRLNVDGAFWAFQAARSAGIKKFVFLSSQAWHGHYDKYGFTKRVGEELCEYHRRANGIGYVAVRPADLTPYGYNWVNGYGTRLLYGGVDRDDVLECVAVSLRRLEGDFEGEAPGIVVDAVRPNAIPAEIIDAWETDPKAALDLVFPGYRDLVEKYKMDIRHRPGTSTETGWTEVGYAPTHHFGTFLAQLRDLDQDGGEDAVHGMHCTY